MTSQVARNGKRRSAAAKKRAPPLTFQEAADRALGLERPELSGDRALAKMAAEAERMMVAGSQGQRLMLNRTY